mmetsp:Transcript_16828/g.31258  ORF Transcript_16828/g.31258 Transcript_16828/m.31258 type:complete len:230 (+) Transcript_16828:280-969(+)
MQPSWNFERRGSLLISFVSHMSRAACNNVDAPSFYQILRHTARGPYDNFVDPLAGTYIQDTLREIHHRKARPFCTAYCEILMNANQQKVAELTRILEELCMTHVEHVKGATDINHSIALTRHLARCKFRNAACACQQVNRCLGTQHIFRPVRGGCRRHFLHRRRRQFYSSFLHRHCPVCEALPNARLQAFEICIADSILFSQVISYLERSLHLHAPGRRPHRRDLWTGR